MRGILLSDKGLRGWLPFLLVSGYTLAWNGALLSARQIIRTTFLEFVVFLVVFVIYWFELSRGHL